MRQKALRAGLTLSALRLQGTGAALSIKSNADAADEGEEDALVVGASDREQFSIPKLLKQHIAEVSHPALILNCQAASTWPAYRTSPSCIVQTQRVDVLCEEVCHHRLACLTGHALQAGL
jgi:hypothetical protein